MFLAWPIHKLSLQSIAGMRTMNHNSNRSRHVSFTNAFSASGSAAEKISARWVPNSKEHQPSLASTSIALDSFLYRLFAILSVALISLVLVKLAWGSPLPPNVGLTNGNAIGTKKTELRGRFEPGPYKAGRRDK